MRSREVLIRLEFESVHDINSYTVENELTEAIQSGNLDWWIENPTIGGDEE